MFVLIDNLSQPTRYIRIEDFNLIEITPMNTMIIEVKDKRYNVLSIQDVKSILSKKPQLEDRDLLETLAIYLIMIIENHQERHINVDIKGLVNNFAKDNEQLLFGRSDINEENNN